ncbi:MAG: hypothetical protein IJH94_02035 [Clostridia bacterium]|nr:hypothetical protein [Clostridia bacterium]
MYIIKKGFSTRIGKKALRGLNISKTSEQQKRINEELAAERRAHQILNNFDARHDNGREIVPGDWWITLTYRRECKPESLDEAHTNLTKLLKKLRRKNKEFKYIAKTEDPGNGNYHHHMIISRDISLDDIHRLWSEFSNHIEAREIYNLSDMSLLDYFLKGAGTHKCKAAKYAASRNLEKPVVIVKIIRAGHWRREPRPKRGYEVKDVQNYFDCFGFEAQKYIMRRLI